MGSARPPAHPIKSRQKEANLAPRPNSTRAGKSGDAHVAMGIDPMERPQVNGALNHTMTLTNNAAKTLHMLAAIAKSGRSSHRAASMQRGGQSE
jgi:hypothetical protein